MSGSVCPSICLSVCSSWDGLVGCKGHCFISMTCIWAYLRACRMPLTCICFGNVKLIHINFVLYPTHELTYQCTRSSPGVHLFGRQAGRQWWSVHMCHPKWVVAVSIRVDFKSILLAASLHLDFFFLWGSPVSERAQIYEPPFIDRYLNGSLFHLHCISRYPNGSLFWFNKQNIYILLIIIT